MLLWTPIWNTSWTRLEGNISNHTKLLCTERFRKEKHGRIGRSSEDGEEIACASAESISIKNWLLKRRLVRCKNLTENTARAAIIQHKQTLMDLDPADNQWWSRNPMAASKNLICSGQRSNKGRKTLMEITFFLKLTMTSIPTCTFTMNRTMNA